MTENEALLERLEAEAEELQFSRFGFEEAWALGQALVAQGREAGLPIAIDIGLGGQTLFHAALPGTSPDNDNWIRRKNRVSLHFHKASLHVAAILRQKGRTIEETYGLSSADYAPSGGSVPIRIRGVGVVGTATVSGLPDHEDHRMVVEALRHLLGRGA